MWNFAKDSKDLVRIRLPNPNTHGFSVLNIFLLEFFLPSYSLVKALWKMLSQ